MCSKMKAFLSTIFVLTIIHVKKSISLTNVLSYEEPYENYCSHVFIKTNSRNCAGIVLDEKNIVTPAQCLVQANKPNNVPVPFDEVKIYYGATDYQSLFSSTVKQLEQKILKIVIHEKYNSKVRFNYDIAIISLESDITFIEQEIQPGFFATSKPGATEEVYVFGFRLARATELLTKMDFNSQCQATTKAAREGNPSYTAVSCTKSGVINNVACPGYYVGGGVYKPNRRTILAIVLGTTNVRCTNDPIIYVLTVADHIAWIRNNIVK